MSETGKERYCDAEVTCDNLLLDLLTGSSLVLWARNIPFEVLHLSPAIFPLIESHLFHFYAACQARRGRYGTTRSWVHRWGLSALMFFFSCQPLGKSQGNQGVWTSESFELLRLRSIEQLKKAAFLPETWCRHQQLIRADIHAHDRRLMFS